jgi:signal transduction histidine kinase
MNKKRLLNISSRHYLKFLTATLILLLPVFYVVVDKLYSIDIKDTLIMRRDEFLKFNAPTFTEDNVSFWNEFNRDVKIIEGHKVKQDSIFHTHFYDELSNENEPYLALYSPIAIEGKPYTYFTRIDLVEATDLVLTLSVLFCLAIVMLISGLFFITRRLSRRVWLPFYDILNKIEHFELDKTALPEFAKSNIVEFTRLSRAVEKLMNKNTRIYHSQKEFIENAAHELQTPVAILKTKTDILLQDPDITEEQAKTIKILDDTVNRMERLNKNLLLLSKIDNDTFFTIKEVVVNDIITKNLEFFTEQARNKDLTINTDLNQILIIKSNPDLTEIFLNNLFMNAIRHNIPQGVINIAISKCKIIFSNTGDEKINSDKLFKRFSKLNPPRHGTGLGLSIVKKIADLNNWTIDYNFSNQEHSFIVSMNS